MERQVHQLVRLVDDLLDLSRIARGKIQLRKDHVSLETIIQTAVETVRPRIDAEHHQLLVELPAEPVYLLADLTRVAQAISNLLVNAAKYTDPGGQIHLTAHCEDGFATIEVHDNGVGIPAEMISEIFDPFVQAEPTVCPCPRAVWA